MEILASILLATSFLRDGMTALYVFMVTAIVLWPRASWRVADGRPEQAVHWRKCALDHGIVALASQPSGA